MFAFNDSVEDEIQRNREAMDEARREARGGRPRMKRAGRRAKNPGE